MFDFTQLAHTGGLLCVLRGRKEPRPICRPLYSDSIIADHAWHYVGVTWDGATRSLYVDDIPVTEDADITLANCDGGVNIGCNGSMAPETLFSSLIDGVRIYNRAVQP